MGLFVVVVVVFNTFLLLVSFSVCEQLLKAHSILDLVHQKVCVTLSCG